MILVATFLNMPGVTTILQDLFKKWKFLMKNRIFDPCQIFKNWKIFKKLEKYQWKIPMVKLLIWSVIMHFLLKNANFWKILKFRKSGENHILPHLLYLFLPQELIPPSSRGWNPQKWRKSEKQILIFFNIIFYNDYSINLFVRLLAGPSIRKPR